MKDFAYFLWNRRVKVLLYLFLSYFSYLMLLITLQYVPIHFDVAFLQIKQDEIALLYYQITFFTHVYTSIFVLFIGLLQFSNTVRINYPKFHRTAGKIYIVLILSFAGPTGLIMGFHANGGIIAQVAFMLMAVFWIYFTAKAFLFAKQRDFERHRKFMLRSFALTLSAITLRLLKLGIVQFWELPPMDVTRIIAWGGWLTNLCLLEICLVFNRKKVDQND